MAATSAALPERTNIVKVLPPPLAPAGRTWRAYLSAAAGGGQPPVNARDRIARNGPWYNAKGVLIAASVADLHGDVQRDTNNIRKPTALDEKGAEVKGVGDQPNQHDILTGSDSHGRIMIGAAATLTCNNWTKQRRHRAHDVAHHDRLGGPMPRGTRCTRRPAAASPRLVKTGGNGCSTAFAQQGCLGVRTVRMVPRG